MNIKKSELMDKISESRKFIAELIYENIGVNDKNIRLEYENTRLREKIERLEKDKKESRKNGLKKEQNGYVVLVFVMGQGYVN